jgi:hypothetical protein
MARKTTGRRRRGGQELPDRVQDRPEQNQGYDEAVRNPAGMPDTASDMGVDGVGDDGRGMQIEDLTPRDRSKG